MKYNILLTAIGSMSARCVINELKKDGHKVYGIDIYPKEWHYEALMCDKFVQAPLATNELEYINFIVTLIGKFKIQFLFPLTDVEVDVLNNNRTEIESLNVVLCCPSNNVLNIVRNKYNIYKSFENDKFVPSIRTLTIKEDLSVLKTPYIAKPFDGRSSEGLKIIVNEKEISLIENVDKYIFQEKIEGSIITVDYVRSENEEFSIQREELLRTKNGAGTTVRIFKNDSLEKLVSYIGNKLDIKGTINMEFIKNNNQFYLIDINPRFSAGVAFSCLAGYNFVLAHLNTFTKTPIPNSIDVKEQVMVKCYEEFSIKKVDNI